MLTKTVLTVFDRLFKTNRDELAEALQISDDDDADVDDSKVITLLETKVGERVKQKFDAGFQKAEKAVRSKVEKELKEKFDIESDLQGLELVEHIVNQQIEQKVRESGGTKTLTDEEIKKHPLFLKLEKEKAAEVKKLTEDYESKLKAEKESREYETVLKEVDTESLKIFKELGDAILPEDPDVAKKQIDKLLLKELRDFKFQKIDGSVVILDADGNRVEDKAGNAKSLKDLVTEIAKSNFSFKAAKDRNAPANSNDKGGKGGNGQQQAKKYSGKAPATQKEYMETLLDPSIDREIKSDYQKQFGEKFNQVQQQN